MVENVWDVIKLMCFLCLPLRLSPLHDCLFRDALHLEMKLLWREFCDSVYEVAEEWKRAEAARLNEMENFFPATNDEL